MIAPTIGRIVWYWPGEADKLRMTVHDWQPLAASVAYVWTNDRVNLVVSDHEGRQHQRRQVHLLQGAEQRPADGVAFCEWMPYQKAVAKGEIAPTLHADKPAG